MAGSIITLITGIVLDLIHVRTQVTIMARHRMESDGDAKRPLVTSQIPPIGAADIDWGSSDAGWGVV